jgi:dipeptidase D
MENRKAVVLQAHMDMVPQKNSHINHNFETDPIRAYIDGEWVKARGTTLGADNGIGMASALAVLADENVEESYLLELD